MSSSEPVAEWTSSLPQETNDSGRASHGPHDPTPRTVNEIPSTRPASTVHCALLRWTDTLSRFAAAPVGVVAGDETMT